MNKETAFAEYSLIKMTCTTGFLWTYFLDFPNKY